MFVDAVGQALSEDQAFEGKVRDVPGYAGTIRLSSAGATLRLSGRTRPDARAEVETEMRRRVAAGLAARGIEPMRPGTYAPVGSGPTAVRVSRSRQPSRTGPPRAPRGRWTGATGRGRASIAMLPAADTSIEPPGPDEPCPGPGLVSGRRPGRTRRAGSARCPARPGRRPPAAASRSRPPRARPVASDR